jgi:hypothetical protein
MKDKPRRQADLLLDSKHGDNTFLGNVIEVLTVHIASHFRRWYFFKQFKIAVM